MVISRDFVLLSYYEQREHFEHDEAVRRVAASTGADVEAVDALIQEAAV